MKHLKLFEAFGIDKNIESQVDQYFDQIQQEPDRNEFKFLFTNDAINVFFKLKIVPHHWCAGSFLDYKNGGLEIILKDRNDISTLLHEVKHLDYRFKNKKLYQTVQHKASEVLNNYANTPACLIEIFYVYDKNEFESKYHGYYKGFKSYCKDKLDKSYTLAEVKNLWFKYLLSCDDKTWTYYLVDKDFKFEHFISERKLNECLYQMLEAGVTDKPDLFKWSKNWITNNLKNIWNQFRKNLGLYSKEEKIEIEKLKKYFENLFLERHHKYKRKFTRMILLVAQDYGIGN